MMEGVPSTVVQRHRRHVKKSRRGPRRDGLAHIYQGYEESAPHVKRPEPDADDDAYLSETPSFSSHSSYGSYTINTAEGSEIKNQTNLIRNMSQVGRDLVQPAKKRTGRSKSGLSRSSRRSRRSEASRRSTETIEQFVSRTLLSTPSNKRKQHFLLGGPEDDAFSTHDILEDLDNMSATIESQSVLSSSRQSFQKSRKAGFTPSLLPPIPSEEYESAVEERFSRSSSSSQRKPRTVSPESDRPSSSISSSAPLDPFDPLSAAFWSFPEKNVPSRTVHGSPLSDESKEVAQTRSKSSFDTKEWTAFATNPFGDDSGGISAFFSRAEERFARLNV